MYFAPVPSHHLAYIRANKGEAVPYLLPHIKSRPIGFLEGFFGRPQPVGKRPADWSSTQAEEILIDANLGTDARVMHFLLNETQNSVEGPTNLFQVWIRGTDQASERIDGRDGSAFIHDLTEVKLVQGKLVALDRNTFDIRWKRVLTVYGYDEDDFDPAYAAECIARLSACYEAASKQDGAVLWMPDE
jgi:hypothetical protein